MASNKLAELRAKLAQAQEQTSGSRTGGDNAIYPFWNIKEGDSVTFRFLPDADNANPFFWVERNVIKLKFPGVRGHDETKSVIVQVPCGEMFGDNCPVLTEVRPWYKDASLKEMAGQYWKKRSYIFQGFVLDDPMKEEDAPENPIRRFVIGPQIYNIIKEALMDPDMENIPTDYTSGTDFRLNKGKKGEYADYSTSKWARKERSLNETELAAIDEYGLFNLADFLPARPTADGYQVIKEMFEASVDGELYDPSKWGEFYKPYGLDLDSGVQKSSAPAQTSAPAPAPAAKPDDDDEPPFDTVATAEVQAPVEKAPVEAAAGGQKKSADDILAMIRNRKDQ